MAVVTIRPINAEGYDWFEPEKIYDGDASITYSTVLANKNNYLEKILTCSFDTTQIADVLATTGGFMDRATLKIVCKQSMSNNNSIRYTPFVDINGDETKRVYKTMLANTSVTTLNIGVMDYLTELTHITFTASRTGTSGNNYMYMYEMYLEIEYNYYDIVFQDYDGTVLKTETVIGGDKATAPSDPKRFEHTFIGWDQPFHEIRSNLTLTAQYVQGEVKRFRSNNNIVDKFYIGDSPVKKMYIGNTLVYYNDDL